MDDKVFFFLVIFSSSKFVFFYLLKDLLKMLNKTNYKLCNSSLWIYHSVHFIDIG